MIPKQLQGDKECLIVELSHPKGYSINQDIPIHLYSLSSITVDDAI